MNTGGPETRLIDGRFELLQPLGGGGMGLVWRARDNALQREVALKEVRPPDPAMAAANPTEAREMRERVLREARALARLQHPNVVIIHHIVDTPDHTHPWLVMELVSGGSLADRLARGPLTVPEAAGIGRGVLSALRAAHAAGIQHRDVKPGNVLLRTDGTPVLTDFGIAAMHGSTALTAAGALIGSPEFIAPERIRGEEGNPSSDLWSLGMMLYVALEGHHPLRRATTLATLAAVLDEPLPPPVHAGQLGPTLSALLARDPAARPDAEQLDRLLAAAEQSVPVATPTAWAPTSLDTPRPTPSPYAAPADHVPTGYVPQDRVPWIPEQVTGHPGATGPVNPWLVQGTQPVKPPSPGGKRTGLVIGAVAVVVLAGVLAWSMIPADTGSRTGATTGTSTTTNLPATTATGTAGKSGTSGTTGGSNSTAPADLMTPDGVRATIAAMRPSMPGTKAVRLVVYPGYAIAEVPTANDAKLYDDLTYRNSRVTKAPGGTVTDDYTVDLQTYNWDILPSLLQKAQDTLNIPHPTSKYFIIGPDIMDGTPSISVYFSDEYNSSAYLEVDVKGDVIRSVPRA